MRRWYVKYGSSITAAAAPLFVLVAYPEKIPRRATFRGPAVENPPDVDLDQDHAKRLAKAALAEPDRHVASRFLASALEGRPGEQPGLRNKGLLVTHELLYGVLKRSSRPANSA